MTSPARDRPEQFGELWRKTDQFSRHRLLPSALELHADDDPEERFSTEHNSLGEAASGEIHAAESGWYASVISRTSKNSGRLTPRLAGFGDLAWTDKRHNLALQRYGHAILYSSDMASTTAASAELNRAHLLLGRIVQPRLLPT